MALSGCYAVLKYIVVFLTLIFWLAGLAVLSISIWFLADPTMYLHMLQNGSSYIGFYVLLGAGVLMFVVGFLGCSGAYRESQCMLVSFFCFLLIILVAEIAAGAWAYSHSNKLEEIIKKQLTTTVQEEYSITDGTVSFDNLQKMFECCGASGPSDWSNSMYNNETNRDKATVSMTLRSEGTYNIPTSCCIDEYSEACKKDTMAKFADHIPNSIHPEGCATKLFSLLKDNSDKIIAVCIAIAALEILGLIFSIILCCAIRAIESYKA